ncbi:TonB-dependent siderophore receptor [Glaciecola petra]|uniref:TonB-dependent receptor plug domain-containing protein n=1 Tax=Glaciecola petra TaxID=3075602 RepID=A0ABU2ZU41_9ALTE|nr:TonB-dependent receptor plug domain-containing protein [Aestuariibacter sp. P117]MDT0596163.1 TonB-dependent receptor plug domain-containing protein [Aestuariibacter sp. P117]
MSNQISKTGLQKNHKHRLKALAVSIAIVFANQAFAQDAEETTEEDVERIEVTGSLGSLPGQDVESVFGFGKSILETPRSVSTISDEQLARFSVSDIDELVAFAPGTFTQSFFGVAGSLDVRGTPGETYFRGVKRLDNPGNYPTPIGASSSIDIVRGPASPIYGPSKIGGYLNFNPKSARASSGQYLDENVGAFSYTTGTWDKSVMTAELGGPGTIAGKEMGFYLYGEVENSGSYYENSGVDQTVLQASFNVDISPNLRIEFGGMYHDYDGNQIAGWNRLSQDLIDNGTYVTGTAKPLDTDGDGSISHQEYNVERGGINPFIFNNADFGLFPDRITNADFDPILALDNPGTTTLRGDQVMVAPDDVLLNTVNTLYFDVFYYTDSGWEIKNQMFYEDYENLNENAYGFSQFHDSSVFENKLVFSNEYETDSMLAQIQISPSIRHTKFLHGDDFTNEYFDRRDLTGPSTALDRRLLATRIGRDFDNYDDGDYTNLGLAVLTDLTWEMGLNIVLGVRYDTIDVETTSRGDLLLTPAEITTADATFDDVSWNTSISFKTDFGLIPYITAAEQATLVAGQGAEIGVGQLPDGAFDTSDLFEYGVKGSFLDDSLYFALSIYEQERTDFNAQAIVTNATTENEGIELELRWVVNENLVVGAGFTQMKVYNLTALENGNQFGFFGAEDLPNVTDSSLLYGGAVIGLNLVDDKESARKAGIPENIFTLNATYDFQNGYAVNASVIKADETFSGFSQTVTLPAYTLVNLGVFYEAESWTASFNVKNATDERYFRANFPDLFGAQIVLPELPRHFQAKFSYKF